jgi:colicin import membrane protein
MRIAPAETSAPAETGTELAVLPALEAIVPAEFFKPSGSDAILTTLEETVMAMRAKLDISTEGGRRAIASLAYRVSRSKTALDKLREDLVRDRKVELKSIDKEGGVVWDRVEALQKKVRAELDKWEEAEKVRVGAHEWTIGDLVGLSDYPKRSSQEILEALEKAESLFAHRDWQEFGERAMKAYNGVRLELNRQLDSMRKAEEERAELARLRQEEYDRKEAARVQAIADEAAARERKLAEDRAAEIARLAEVERQRVENERHEAEAKAKQAEARRVEAERQAVAMRERVEREARETEERLQRQIEQERIDAEHRRIEEAEYAEQKRIAREQEIERERKAAEEKAERDRVAAIEAERKRVADEAERVRLETEKRERNKKHRERIEAAAAEGLIFRFPMQIELARDLIKAISEGLIPNITINY